MGFQVGRSAVMAGQEYMEQNFGRFVRMQQLKHYFNVSNRYVIGKLLLVLFPWRHSTWLRRRDADGMYAPPREDVNSPDLYIPTMAFVTYILLSTLLAGLRKAFHPELFGMVASTAIFVIILEIIILWIAMYILSINNESQLLDLASYSGYKFVGVIISLVLSEVWNHGGGTGGWVGWAIFMYAYAANAFFLLRSLRYVLLPDVNQSTAASGSFTTNRAQKQRRVYFLSIYSFFVQFVFMWLLTRQDSAVVKIKTNGKI